LNVLAAMGCPLTMIDGASRFDAMQAYQEMMA
jgi:hypothetical protein